MEGSKHNLLIIDKKLNKLKIIQRKLFMNYCSKPQILKAGIWRSDIAYFLVEHI